MKKILSLVLALAMVMMVGSVYAATFTGTAEDEIVALGLASGDTVSVYQVVEFDATNNEWKLTTLGAAGFADIDAVLDGVSAAEADAIAIAASGDGTAMGWDSENSRFSLKPVAAGMYYIKAIPADPNTVYNPAFVSADYYQGGNSVTFSTEIGNGAYIKKSEVPFDKVVNSELSFADVKPGDVIPYKVTTTIPSYGTNFTNPVFKIEDTLSDGLALEGDVKVKYGATEITATDDNVTITKTASGYTVEFKADYLKSLSAASTAVEITYSAKVTTAALDNVTYMDNLAKLTFSHTPNETKDKDDITRHYTFSIDGNLLGQTHKQTSELIKVKCDKDGNPIFDVNEESVTYYDDPVSPLDGASFTLKPVAPTTGSAKTVNSADGGHIQFLGLDAGIYELVENSAPSGYVKDSNTYEIMIDPVYDDPDSDAPILQSYSIKFRLKGAEDWATISTFGVQTNDGGTEVISATEPDAGSYIGNTPGAELPSTGGIGTTIFYVLGGVLVIGAAVILVARRKAHD